ncbi:nicotinate-nucleotide adenylyltransferase [Candidatus Hepatincola sp. Av]
MLKQYINIKTHNLNFLQHTSLYNLPTHLKVGIYGGSFNPPHKGQLYIAEQAIKRLDLNVLLWLVTPLNPLKTKATFSLQDRVLLSKELTKFNYKIKVSSFEDSFSQYYSYFTLEKLKQLSSNNSLTWIMGEDNLANFHHFVSWQSILSNNNIAVFARNEFSYSSLLQKASFVYKRNQIGYFNNEGEVKQPLGKKTWLKFFLLPKNKMSSTLIRQQVLKKGYNTKKTY